MVPCSPSLPILAFSGIQCFVVFTGKDAECIAWYKPEEGVKALLIVFIACELEATASIRVGFRLMGLVVGRSDFIRAVQQ